MQLNVRTLKSSSSTEKQNIKYTKSSELKIAR